MKSRLLAAAVTVLVLLGTFSFLWKQQPQLNADFHLDDFTALPALKNGRVKPLDTIARNSLLIIYGKRSLRLTGKDQPIKRLSAIEWLAEVMMDPDTADKRKVFLIHNHDVLTNLGWTKEDGKYFAYADLITKADEVQRQAELARKVEVPLRNLFQKDILKLYNHLLLYHRLSNSLEPAGTRNFLAEVAEYERQILPAVEAARKTDTEEQLNNPALAAIAHGTQRYNAIGQLALFHPVPPADPVADAEGWLTVGTSLMGSLKTGKVADSTRSLATLTTAWENQDADTFNTTLDELLPWLTSHVPDRMRLVRAEVFFNEFAPFYRTMVLYVLVFILACASWLALPRLLGNYAFWLLVAGFVIHTVGLIFRMVLEGRPPVTNLYSSAVFIGWGAVLLGIFLERFFRNGIGSATAAALGFTTLVVAHHLSMDGDTMEMMRAVLDTNGWLATHVVCITLGYSATYLSGFLAILFILRGALTKSLDKDTGKSLIRMIYGIVCFATLFSFVGTLLGGIWADQSWGRFWGWDPKENGAALIVLWNAIILHARWGGLVRARGLAVMAVFGNIVTSWSWFGTNMLGVGLHSYGFMDSAYWWLLGFIASQLLIMLIATLPPRFWRSAAVAR